MVRRVDDSQGNFGLAAFLGDFVINDQPGEGPEHSEVFSSGFLGSIRGVCQLGFGEPYSPLIYQN
jgi:hypothetical protein